jgi:hypothetical protein
MRAPLAIAAALVLGGTFAQTAAADPVIDTQLLTAPAEAAYVTSGASAFVAWTEYGDSFECSLDHGPWLACGVAGADGTAALSVPAVADGEHTLSVRARSGADVDPTPVVRRWSVDTVAPETTITALDGGAFKFTATEQATFSCRLDGGQAFPCGTPLGVIPYGAHMLEATATDVAGNSDPTPAVHRWTTTAPPVTTPTPLATTTTATPAPASRDELVDAPPLTAPALALAVTHRFRDGRFTRIATNQKVTITLKRTGKRSATVSLYRLVGLKLANGTKVTFRAATSTKTLTVRRGKAV